MNQNPSGSGPVCGSGAVLVPEGACCERVDKFSLVSAQSGSLSSAREKESGTAEEPTGTRQELKKKL